MNWDDVRIFLAVARSGQILAASRSIGLNHATVARRLNTFEETLGIKLFVRRPNGSALSAEGERFLQFAMRMESEMLAARDALGASDEGISGTVRIGAPDGFGTAYLTPRLVQLAERYPDLNLELVPVPLAFSLSRRDVDLAVTLERPREGRLIARKLIDYRLSLYAAPDYLEKYGTPTTVDDLQNHRLVGYVEDLLFSPALNYADTVLKGWQSRIAVSTAIGQTEAVKAGAGIAILHSYIAALEPGLVPVLPSMFLKRSYWTVVHETMRSLHRVAVVSEFLTECIREDRAIFA